MPNPIPTAARATVSKRDRGLCVRCSGRGTDHHHRRSRSVRDEHTHCPCNLILLCRTCHSTVHAQPTQSMTTNLIVSRYNPQPAGTPMLLAGEWWFTHCSGSPLSRHASVSAAP